MNILDTMGVSRIFDESLSLNEDYFLSPDVSEEVEVTELVHDKRIPKNIFKLEDLDEFNQAFYIKHYKNILNSYKKRSFYNMTGFGDVSILATLYMLKEISENQQQGQLFDTHEQITVYTNDDNLASEISRVFSEKDVTVFSVSEIY